MKSKNTFKIVVVGKPGGKVQELAAKLAVKCGIQVIDSAALIRRELDLKTSRGLEFSDQLHRHTGGLDDTDVAELVIEEIEK